MLSPTLVLWDIGYFIYTYGSIFIIILLICQVKRSHSGLKLEPNKSHCQRHQRARQRPRDGIPRARRHFRKEAEKPGDLLTVMKSQNWLPKEGKVRRLLCADRCCHICNDVALEIQQLLASEKKTNAGATQPSSNLAVLSVSSVSFEQTVELRYKELSMASVTPTLSQLTDEKSLTHTRAPSTGMIDIGEYWTKHLGLKQEFQLPDVAKDPGSMSPPRVEELTLPVNQQEMMNTSYKFVQGDEDQQSLNSHVHLLSPKTELTNLTHPLALPMDTVLSPHLPFLSPEVLGLLEIHVKKWVHFQRWGLPRRVEESFKQLMPDPPLFYQPGKSQPTSFIKHDSSVCVETIGTISYETWGSCIVGQPTQAFWVSEWSVIDLKQSHYCQETSNPLALALPSPAHKILNGVYPQPGGQTEDIRDPLKQSYSQLFCGLPCLHSESLVANFMGSQGLSMNKSLSQTSSNVPLLFNEPSFLPLLPNNLSQSVSPSSPPTPNWVSPPDHEQIQIHVPFLTLAECDVLEWHLLQKQLQRRWDLSPVFQRPPHAQKPMKYGACDTAQSPETMEAFWSGKSVSVLPRELLFFPDHARRLLEFHLQKQLIYHHWGLPQKIKQSIQLFLSPTDQQQLPWSSSVLDNASVPKSAVPQTNGVSDPFSPTLAPVSFLMPHSPCLAQAKSILQSHINSKYWQIRQGSVPTRVCISWDCRIPGSLAGPSFPCIPRLQEAADTNLHQKVTPCMPTATEEQQQTLPGAAMECTKLPQCLPTGAIQKLETALRHKYLAFLSGLPALYYVALSKAMAPATITQSAIAKTMPEPAEITTEPLTEMLMYEEQCVSTGPAFQVDNETCIDSAQEFLTEAQEEKPVEMVPQESKTEADSPHPFRASILTKLNFHLRKKILEIQLGIPMKARESRDQTAAIPENISIPTAVVNLNNEGKPSLQEFPIPTDIPHAPDPEWVHLKEQLATELKAAQQSQKQASYRAAPHGYAHWVSKISQPSENMTDKQVLCVQIEDGVNSPSLKEAWCPESQGPGKSKDSVQVTTEAEKEKDPEKNKPAGDQGEGDAGLGLTSTKGSRQPDEDQRPAGKSLNKAPRGPRRRSHSFDLAASCHLSSHHCAQLKHLELPPGLPGGKESENDLKNSQVKLNPITEPVSIHEIVPPVVSYASQDQPQGQMITAHTHKNPSFSESGIKSKMKQFLHCMNLKTRGKADDGSMLSPVKTGTKTRRKSAEKNLTRAKGTMGQAKTKKTAGDSKAQPSPTEKQAGLTLFNGPQTQDNQLWHRFHQLHSASVLASVEHILSEPEKTLRRRGAETGQKAEMEANGMGEEGTQELTIRRYAAINSEEAKRQHPTGAGGGGGGSCRSSSGGYPVPCAPEEADCATHTSCTAGRDPRHQPGTLRVHGDQTSPIAAAATTPDWSAEFAGWEGGQAVARALALLPAISWMSP
ncbi:PREDICTED: protein FAM205A-like [Chrysochloris asiatica]|uniref:Protein FAM205A-like n=1 Tax=Chrysochloris asiatica TaxID=185453 RepID=A0A9B0T1M8_CHRAS|nr:PREDICTED: protein FAM205A-like [Chrysochloris asiatica]